MCTMNKKNILIVDDQELNRGILALILKDNYNIIEASNGKEAWNIMLKMGPEISLILLDIIMPVMDGMMFLRYMQNAKAWKDIPIIFVTSETYEDNILDGLRMGVRDVIAKPFEPYLIRNRVNNLIRLTSPKDGGIFPYQAASGSRKPSVLIVDDSLISRSLLKKALDSSYEILEASDGLAGLELVESHSQDIAAVLLDIVMPVMDGIEMMRELKCRKLLEGVPLLVVTGGNSVLHMEQLHTLGIYEIIHKPFNPAVIKNRVDNMIAIYFQRPRP